MGKKKGIRVGATIGMVAGIYQTWHNYQHHGGVNGVIRGLTGWDMGTGAWNYKTANAALPMLAGVALSMVAAKTGMNRYTPTGINI